MAYPHATRRISGRMPAAPTRRLGTWKLAYADFLTALAAFFLVMWLVKGVPSSGRHEIAAYFDDGAVDGSRQTGQIQRPDTIPLLIAALARELKTNDPLQDIDIVPDPLGIRIEIMDSSQAPLFETGRGAPTDLGRFQLARVFQRLSAGHWPVTIEGHTDAFPFTMGERDNWSLSVERAEGARQVAIAEGISSNRVVAVTGYADTRPRLPREPHHASNRRVSVVLHVTAQSSIPVSS